jgi:hypothetical protein
VLIQSSAAATVVSSSGATAPTAAQVAAEVLAAAQITPIHADMRRVKGQTIDGSGSEADPWGPT